MPRLAVASYPVRLSRHTCACGMPNVINPRRDGVFVFVWEWNSVGRQQYDRRPLTSIPPPGHLQRFACQGPDNVTLLHDHGRGFQVEPYIGPDASRAARAQLLTVLNSLRVGA